MTIRKRKVVELEPVVDDGPSPQEVAHKIRAAIEADYFTNPDSYECYLLDSLEADHALLVRLERCISKQGLTVADRYGNKKPNPLLSAVKDVKNRILATLKMMNLDLEPVKDVGRPPGA